MPSLVGRWMLVDARASDAQGNAVPPPLGDTPRGLILYEAERMMVVVCDGSTELPPGRQRAFISYTGRYRFDGEILRVDVDGASSSDYPREQIRRIRFEGPDRYVALPLSADGGDTGLRLTWERLR